MAAIAFCMLGMHRSGTSAMAGTLRLLGVELGERLAPGHRQVNERGYFEHIDVIGQHIALLADLGSSWDDVLPLPDRWWKEPVAERHAAAILAILKRDFAGARFWGVKDPRLCRLMPLWFPLLDALGARPCLPIMLRRPDEVAASLARRDRMPAEKAYQVWLVNTLEAERWSRGHPRAFIAYDALLRDPVGTLEAVAATLAIQWPIAPATVRKRLAGFLSEDLRHHRSSSPRSGDRGPAAALAFEVWSALAAAGTTGPELAVLDALQTRHERRIAGFDEALVAHLRSETRRRIDYQRQLRELHDSLAWKLTKPLRLTSKLGSRLRGTRPSPRLSGTRETAHRDVDAAAD